MKIALNRLRKKTRLITEEGQFHPQSRVSADAVKRIIEIAYYEGIRAATGLSLMDIEKILRENPNTDFTTFNRLEWFKKQKYL